MTPHVTQNQAVTKTGKTRNSAIDERTTRHQGDGMSQSRRAMVECIFGWGKQHGTMRKTKHRGFARVAIDFLLNLIAYNLIRIPKLLAALQYRAATPPSRKKNASSWRTHHLKLDRRRSPRQRKLKSLSISANC